jgi:hypothetical protein
VAVDLFWNLLAIAVLVGMAWLAFRLEPHWVSKDGERMIVAGQPLDRYGNQLGRWRETRLMVLDGRTVRIDRKGFLKHNTSYWTVAGESDDPPKKKVVFLLSGNDPSTDVTQMAIRFPASSRGADTLRALIRRD